MTSHTAGYISSCIAVRKDRLSRAHIAYLHDNLEFSVDGSGDLMQCYDEDETHYFIPRGVLLDPKLPELPPLSDQRVMRSAKIPDPIIQLRPDQKMPLKKLRKAGGGVLHAPTGAGKTIVGLYLVGKMKQKTLVIVHTKDLLYQWVDRAKFVLGLEDHQIGIIGDGQWEERDLTIAMVQTLSRFDFHKSDFMQQWGMVIQDECHRCPAAMFAKVVQSTPARYLYGLTATPTRNDGMHPLMHAILGPTVARIKESGLIEKGRLVLPVVEMIETDFVSDKADAMARTNNSFARQKLYQGLVKELTEDYDRNVLIRDLVLRHKDRSGLLLSERVEHLHVLHDMILAADWTVRAYVVTSKTPGSEREHIINDVRDNGGWLLSTQLADEGLDIPRLSILILTFPGKAVEKLTQRIGRIMRSYEGKTAARVYDLVDVKCQVFVNQAMKRRAVYKQMKSMKCRGWRPNRER